MYICIYICQYGYRIIRGLPYLECVINYNL